MFGDNPAEHKELYDLEFKFLPKLFELYEDAIHIFDNFNDKKLIDIDFIQKIMPGENLDWREFNFEKKELPNNVKEFIYDFGVPKTFPLCRYAIFYADDANRNYQYITLEKTILAKKYPYIVCGQKGTQHLNYQLECPDNLETFEQLVKKIIDEKIQPLSGFKFNNEEKN